MIRIRNELPRMFSHSGSVVIQFQSKRHWRHHCLWLLARFWLNAWFTTRITKREQENKRQEKCHMIGSGKFNAPTSQTGRKSSETIRSVLLENVWNGLMANIMYYAISLSLSSPRTEMIITPLLKHIFLPTRAIASFFSPIADKDGLHIALGGTNSESANDNYRYDLCSFSLFFPF